MEGNSKLICLPSKMVFWRHSENGSTMKGNTLLPVGTKSFLLE